MPVALTLQDDDLEVSGDFEMTHEELGLEPFSIGDVIISPAYVHAQAEDRGTTAENEMQLMVAHGILHLLGYDHVTDSEAEHMEGRERELLARVGVERR